MKKYFKILANALLGASFKDLNSGEQKVIESIAQNTSVAENVNESFKGGLTLGQRVADKIATFGGSWSFIGLFFAFIAGWILINTF